MTNLDDEISKLINRTLPANDNTNSEQTPRAVPYENRNSWGINVVGNNNIIIDANLLVLTSGILFMIIINMLLGR